MKTLDKYILKKLTIYFTIITPAFLFVILLIKIIEKFGKFKHLNIKDLAGYLFFYIPENLHYIFPIAVVLSIFIFYSDLIKSRKIYAILLNGISIKYISYIFIVFGFFITFLQIFNLEFITPYAKEKRTEFYEKLKGQSPEPTKHIFISNIWVKLDKTKYTYFGFLDLNKKEGKDFIFIQMKDKEFTPLYRVEAKEIKIKDNVLLLTGGKIVTLSSIEKLDFSKFKKLEFPIKLDINNLKNLVKVKKPVSITQFWQKAIIADKFGYPSAYFWSKFFSSLTTVFASIVLTIFTTGLLWIKMKEKYIFIFGGIFVYWYSVPTISSLAEAGVVPAFIILFVNFVYIFIGMFLVLKRKFIEL